MLHSWCFIHRRTCSSHNSVLRNEAFCNINAKYSMMSSVRMTVLRRLSRHSLVLQRYICVGIVHFLVCHAKCKWCLHAWHVVRKCMGSAPGRPMHMCHLSISLPGLMLCYPNLLCTSCNCCKVISCQAYGWKQKPSAVIYPDMHVHGTVLSGLESLHCTSRFVFRHMHQLICHYSYI